MKVIQLITACLIMSGAPLFSSSAAAKGAGIPFESAEMLSAFGERPAFSPDGSRVAFIGKSYGDVYEIDLATGNVRNLTNSFPHQGFLRVHYLHNGDYLLIGPRRNTGAQSRIKVDLYVLDRSLLRGLWPLEQSVFEGVAIGPHDEIAWQQIPAGSILDKGETWLQASQRLPLETYVGRIEYDRGKPRLKAARRIAPGPEGCRGEVQDFRRNGTELVLTCGGSDGAGRFMGIFGHDLTRDEPTTFHKARDRDYAEVEGVAPDGSWAAVECGRREGAEVVPLLDICRLELVPDGKLSPLIVGTAPGSTRKVSNPVISPDAKSVAFQVGDAAIGDIGEGGGVYLMRIAD
ncbi:MAG TPA: hypothetical protein VJM34_17630 [Novosphingobium sp.]|nr:hypothetical protein [Novosphingobium sp.]